MEKKIRKVVRSEQVVIDLADIYQYGLETFGRTTAEIFLEEIIYLIQGLSFQYYQHPECRFLPTKTKKYRNIIIGKYLIIYRIAPGRIEILRALHNSRSISFIRSTRSIKL